ncbi:Fmu (Sun) domain protein [Flexistipes sinusarabici DSM 4947]|uniref:Fmu (Sun) domain protein n=1 Tax=Flexistipes sinusarabici (strain ATCC 49648 / DSM 4947 / MAS 10) TaxID=717231 RepID=F8E7N5_FLESM|nr:RsmB/NOP family class I SAM-dependent RNA methyltransferase [Flexistipes sinusarabici]AEI13880.1 Fmu (Sun) domain protein [Flexistipes sinusarabici DSM 4947]
MPDKFRRRLLSLLLSFYNSQHNGSSYLEEDFFEDSGYQRVYRKIYFNIFRNLGFIERILTEYTKNLKDKKAKSLLVLGTSQIFFMDDIPDYACINETVKLAPVYLKKFINATLRNIARNKEVLIQSYSIKENFPDWFVQKWANLFSNDCELDNFLNFFNKSPEFHSINMDSLTPEPYIKNASRSYPMDLASFYIPMLSGNIRASSIMDACAAPGGKTLVLSQLHPNAKITALDKDSKRSDILAHNVKKYNADNVRIINEDFLNFNLKNQEKFDLILLDAPCTGLGTMKRHPEIRWLRTREDIKKMASYQNKFLEKASQLVTHGGYILYSVCSLEAEEGIDVINNFIDSNPNFKIFTPNFHYIPSDFFWGKFYYTLPHKTLTDGFFAALLKNTA